MKPSSASLSKPRWPRVPGWMLMAVLVVISLAGPSVSAQTANAAARPDRARTDGLGSDIKAYVSAPFRAQRGQWIRFATAAGAIAFAYRLDDDAREHFAVTIAPPGLKVDTKDAEHALPAALALGGTWLAATVLGDADGKREARAMLEAAAFSGAAALLLQETAARRRPYETEDRSDWRADSDSFPSAHTTAAFAIGAVLAESGNDRHRWVRRTLGYGIAAWTAYARMDHGVHWLSDTVAGAALGIATARFVMKRRDATESGRTLRVAPAYGGLELRYSVALR